MTELTHDDLRELLGAYALDAVDGQERAAVSAHLATCDDCARQVAEFHEIAAMLANSGGDAPTHLWERIEGRLADPGTSPSVVREDAGAAATPARRADGAAGPRRVWWLALAACLLAVALLAVEVAHLDGRVGQLSGQSAQQQVARAAQTALADPSARHVALDTPAKARVAQVAILPDGAAFLVNEALPTLPASRTYQLWGMVGTKLVSLGLLGNSPTAIAFDVGAPGTVTGFAVTDERAGGVVQTTHVPVALSAPV
jgi:anti-sigma factor RsiW